MPPKSTGLSVPPSSSTRKSARVASQPPKSSDGKDSKDTDKKAAPLSKKPAPASKKRTADAPDAEDAKPPPASKKAKTAPVEPKTASASKSATVSKPKSATASKSDAVKTKENKTVESKEEKEVEAPKSAKADSGGRGIMKLGDKLPKLTLKDEDGNDVEVGDLAGEKGVVIFLYPKANTPGCTNQACGFRDISAEFGELGYDVYGLSRDGSGPQKSWKTKHGLGYSLLCDPESKLIKRLGAFVAPKNTKRSHFIFEKGSGKLVDIDLGVKPATDPSNALEFVKGHEEK
ncbi:thioredoxin-dependent peroxiredoxin, partial [Tremellales sp. Uapishka_1]